MRSPLCAAALACLALAAPLYADVTDIDFDLTAGSENLFLDDGVWDEGDDWSWFVTGGNGNVQPLEDWIGPGPATFSTVVTSDTPDPYVRFLKDATNHTTFDWTDFHWDFLPDPGTSITIVENSIASDRFSDFMLMNNPDGSASVWFLTDFGAGDTPVLFGETVRMNVRVRVIGEGSFDVVQTPTPEPSSLMMIALLALPALRRR
jgi:hypothetical protein